MLIYNAKIYDHAAKSFFDGDILVRDQKIVALGSFDRPSDENEYIDAHHKPVIPGLIDAHTHGRAGYDFVNTDADLSKMATAYASHGVTTVIPTLASAPLSDMIKAAEKINDFSPKDDESDFFGIHLEGRWLNPAKRGAHAPDMLAPLDARELDNEVFRMCRSLHISAAFELDTDGSFAKKALELGATRYTSNKGLEALREELSRYVLRKYGVSYSDTDEILVTVGGSEAIDAAIRAITNPGDEIIVPQPSYVCYEPMVRLAGGVPIIINTKAENDFKLTAEELSSHITEKTKALILPYPCNPTGAIMEKEDIEALADVLSGTDILVISDEIYAELTFGENRHVSVPSVKDLRERTVLINGFSKTFAMTGWRLGYACGPRAIMAQITKIHQVALMCAPTISQYAAVVELRCCDEAFESMREEYDDRRKIIVSGFNRLGLEYR